MDRRTFLQAALALPMAAAAQRTPPAPNSGVAWTQWGGPHRNFTTEASGIKDTWPASGPRVVWKRKLGEGYSSPAVESAALEMGNGPYSTPLIAGTRVFTTGVAGRLQCFDKKSGKLLWTEQLWDQHRGSRLMYGYASSPIAFRDTIVLPVGGRGHAVMAFNQADGTVAWSANDFGNVYSSPVMINLGGLEQMVLLMDGAVIAINPH